MSTPKVQPLLLPVLKAIVGRAEHPVTEIRQRVADQLRLTDDDLKETYPRSGHNVFVNHLAFALAYFNTGKAIIRKSEGVYQIAERGEMLLARGVSDLTINEAKGL
jgi:restriction system protein